MRQSENIQNVVNKRKLDTVYDKNDLDKKKKKDDREID